MNETKAIRLCLKHKDPVGFDYLVTAYQKKAYYYSATLLGNREDAKDACQEAFSRAFAAITRLKELPYFYPWFLKILRNCCLNMISRRQTSMRYQQAGESADLVRQQTGNPENVFLRNEEQELVWRCLQRLTPEHKEILILKYFQECRYEAISEILAIPKGTVMSRLYSARKEFKNTYHQITYNTHLK